MEHVQQLSFTQTTKILQKDQPLDINSFNIKDDLAISLSSLVAKQFGSNHQYMELTVCFHKWISENMEFSCSQRF